VHSSPSAFTNPPDKLTECPFIRRKRGLGDNLSGVRLIINLYIIVYFIFLAFLIMLLALNREIVIFGTQATRRNHLLNVVNKIITVKIIYQIFNLSMELLFIS
jgi:hypothetical protein